MKLLLLFSLVCGLVSGPDQTTNQKDIDKAMNALKASMEKRSFSLLKPYLDEAYKVGEFSRPKADDILPQIIAQNPKLISFKVKDTKIENGKTVVTLDIAVEGHIFGSKESTTICTFSTANKFISIGYFDECLAGARKVPK